MDAFAQEPLPPDSPLRRVPSAILTPHGVGLTRESLASLTPTAVENVRRILEGHPPLHICNPHLQSAGAARLDRTLGRW